MSNRPLLDTHAWVWWLDGSGDLTRREREHLDRLPVDRRPYLAAISLWEAATLVSRQRLVLRQGFDAWIDVAASPHTVSLVDATPAIAKEMARLPSTFHYDPADRLIVATARALDAPLLTRDRILRRSGLVRLWRA